MSSCHGSVAEHWRLKPEVSWVGLPATAGFFTFLYFRLITTKFIYFQREARCSEHNFLDCPHNQEAKPNCAARYQELATH